MSRYLGPSSVLELLAPSIKEDEKVKAASLGLDKALDPIIKSIPNMLWWARLWMDEKYLSAPMQRLVEYSGGLQPLSDTELELLAWQMHVDFWDINWPRKIREDLIKYSTLWHRLKGTSAGIKKVLELFGIEAVIEEDGKGENWATWQLGLKNSHNYNLATASPNLSGSSDLPDLNRLAKTVYKLAMEMQPQRCRLFRIYNDEFDLRPIYTTLGPALSRGYLSFYSGLDNGENPDIDGDLIISFGQRLKMQSEAYDPDASLGFTINIPIYAPYLDAFRLGLARIGDKFPKNHSFSFYEKIVFLGEDSHPLWQMLPFAISRNQLCLSEKIKPLSNENSRLGKSFATVVDKPAILSRYILGQDMGKKDFTLHEHFTHSYTALCPNLNPGQGALMSFAFIQSFEAGSKPLQDQRPKGLKKGRRWWNYLAYSQFENNKEN